MPLNADYIRGLQFPPIETVVSDRDAMLYALTIGLGRDPLDPWDLPFVYEDGLKVFSTLPLVLGHPGHWMTDPGTGITRAMVVHGEQRFWSYAAVPVDRVIVSENRVMDLYDKGERGAVVLMERLTWDKESRGLIARGESTVFCRADGGFGGAPGPAHELKALPERAPDRTVDIPTEANAALLYRLNQDRNPLHADPAAAKRAGFDRPILHGLASFGMAAAAIARAWPGRALTGIEARFSRPVFPGDTIALDLWDEGGEVAFRARRASGETALDRGRATLA